MPIVYNIPVHLLDRYNGKKVILRSADPAKLVEAFTDSKALLVVGMQLLSLTADIEPLAACEPGLPVELIMSDPQTELALLQRHVGLLDKHTVRVCIPVIPGFSYAAKEAAILQFPIKLELGQPSPAVIEELLAVLNFYFHHSSSAQPIEFFHSTVFSFIDRHPATLWDIQEEDPAHLRYVTDDGIETLARPLLGVEAPDDLRAFVSNLKESLLAERGECFSCQFFANCGGYFKWPSRQYSCDNIKLVFYDLQEAAVELRKNLNIYSQEPAEVR